MTDDSCRDSCSADRIEGDPRALRRTVLGVAGLNGAAMALEMVVAVAIGSVSLFADAVDFSEDTAVNLLIFLALGWSLARRALAGKAMAVIICIPAVAAVWQAVTKFSHPDAPDVWWLIATAGAAAVVNSVCAWLLARFRHEAGSMSKAAFLAARNDVVANLAIIVMGVVTVFWRSGWPDIVLGLLIVALNLTAAKEVWEAAEEEALAARALAGEDLGD
ncbi:cation diffusion facilitator family transporter [Mariniluteicoccus endophyticus]